MIQTHILGFPRIGLQRELKFALEQYWRGDLNQQQLEQLGAELRQRHWQLQLDHQLDWLTVGDFAFYDQMLNQIQLLGCEPKRFGFRGNEPELERYFQLARGGNGEAEASCCAHSHRVALEMTKWFDTNYHYLVPELEPETHFSLNSERLFEQVKEALALSPKVKPVLIGPLTFLWLGKTKVAGFDRLTLLEQLLPVYQQILQRLQALGIEWVQIDEPILGLDLPSEWQQAFEPCYIQLTNCKLKLLLATYFSPLESNLRLACQLPIAGLQVDAVRAPHELTAIADWLPAHKLLSVGIIDGRNIWATDLNAALQQLQPLYNKRGHNLALASSCSLLHVPISLAADTGLSDELRPWLAFATEKLHELQLLQRALTEGNGAIAAELAQSQRIQQTRQQQSCDPAVAQRLAQLPAKADQRPLAFAARRELQAARFQLPLLPTTSIGSFPQTAEIRASRAALRQGRLSFDQYQQQMQAEIARVIQQQESLGLDVLVHGEAERNDMVEYFGEQLAGFSFSSQGWVQSYGSRCVKPPIIYADVARPQAMTCDWASYAQSLTTKPVKGMLTGPITILQWSFVRDDQPRSTTALQIALAIRDEVLDLEQRGIGMIQIDEPALREGLPLRQAGWSAYLDWATRAFRLCASGVANATQIHSHMCYSEFNDILPSIAALDADVISIETSRSDMELLRGFADFAYPNDIGPGVYDIHSPRIPSVDSIKQLLHKALAVVPAQQLWVNPDCGLKTRAWPETLAALRNMVIASHELRRTLEA